MKWKHWITSVLILAVLVAPLTSLSCTCSSSEDGADEQSEDESEQGTTDLEGPVAQAWLVRYDGAAGEVDNANAVAVDSSGNVYVTGSSMGSGTGRDYCTIKYDSNGNQLWAARYDGVAGEMDLAKDIVVDEGGNVYVTGNSSSSDSSYDFTTIKYDTNGNQIWIAHYDGPAGQADRAYALALDISANVYVVGESKGNGTYSDFTTIKYDSNGNELWVNRYDGPASGGDSAQDLALDTSGNVYAVGYTHGSLGYDYTTIKYDADGNELWVARYDGNGNYFQELGQAVTVGMSGNVYVTGYSWVEAGRSAYVTLKYDRDGNQLWHARYDGPVTEMNEANAIAVDGSDNVYVTGGSMGSGTSYDFATIKYDTDGSQIWANRYDGTASGEDIARVMAVDGLGNVYVTGYSMRSDANYDFTTIKYDTDGDQICVASYSCEGTYAPTSIAIAVDGSGNAYVAGSGEGNTYTDYDYITIKYAPE